MLNLIFLLLTIHVVLDLLIYTELRRINALDKATKIRARLAYRLAAMHHQEKRFKRSTSNAGC